MAKTSKKAVTAVATQGTKAERLATAQEYGCSLAEWDGACRKTYDYKSGVVAACTRKAGHENICIYQLPKSHSDAEYDAKQAEKMCREISGHEGEEVRCVLPVRHGGLHQYPTGDEAREEQLRRFNLERLIADARIKEQQMASKKTETKAETSTKGNGRKGNPEALKKAREARESTREADTRKIKVLVKDNPKKGNRAARFSLYKNGMTVDEYVKAGGKRKDVQIDIDHEYISVK